MINYNEALDLIYKLADECSLDTEIISLEAAEGRILADDILSPEYVPSFHNSAMDGFALLSADTITASPNSPVKLSVISTLAAGDEIVAYPMETKAIEIMTGAPVPNQFDSIVKIEDVEVLTNGSGETIVISVRAFVPQGNNIREKGTDYELGQVALPRHTLIRPEAMMALGTLGITEIKVYKKPRAVVLSTGKELVPFMTKNLKPGMIRNSTSVYLKSALPHLGAEVVRSELIGDEVEDFKFFVKKILTQEIDMLITTGAVSMGKYDFIVPALRELGAEIIFHKVAIRPGKPILLAKLIRNDRSPLVIFGMPGNPVSTAVGCRFFLSPYLRHLSSQKPEQGFQVRLAEMTSKAEGLTCFFKGKLVNGEEELRVHSLAGQESYKVNSLVLANVWILLPEKGKQVQGEDTVVVYPLMPDQSIQLASQK